MKMFFGKFLGVAIIPFLLIALSACENAQDATTDTANKNDQALKENASGVYVDYSPAVYSEYVGKKPVVLFFHAPWCPTCVTLEKDIKKNLSSFPEGAKILKIDYDSQTDLKKQYGIVVQSTLVILDKDGKEVNRLNGPTANQLKEAISLTL